MRQLPLLLSAAVLTFVAHATYAADTSTTPTNAMSASSTSSGATSTAPSAAAAPFTQAQRNEIESIIRDFITKKSPDVVVTALQELQQRESADLNAKSKTAIVNDHDKIYGDPTSPVGGNPKGDVTLVEFFDYQCGYCKLAEPTLEKLIKDDKNLKVIYKEYPILGPSSVTAAKAALASVRQGPEKYAKYHTALMASNFSHGQQAERDEELVYKTAKDVGLDVTKLKKDMSDDAIGKILEANVTLGGQVGARGTPTFIVGNGVFPGAMDYDALKKTVDDARAASPASK